MLKSGSAVVSFNAPHRISTCYCDKDGILGYTKNLLRGQSVAIFQGPMTDKKKFTIAIQNTARKQSAREDFYVYDVNGECYLVQFAFEAFCGVGGAAVACKLSMTTEQVANIMDIKTSLANTRSEIINSVQNSHRNIQAFHYEARRCSSLGSY